MNILGIFLRDCIRTGGHKRYFELLEGLSRKGHQVLLVSNASLGYRADRFSCLRVRVPAVKWPVPKSLLYLIAIVGSVAELKSRGKGNDFIVVFGETVFPSALFCKCILHSPILYSSRSNLWEIARCVEAEAGGRLSWIKGKLERLKIALMEKLIAAHADLIIFQNRYEHCAFQKRHPRHSRKALVIGNNLNASWFPPEHKNGNKSERLTKLMYLGALSRRKGFLILLECFKEVAAKNPRLELTVIGSGAYSETLLEQTKDEAFGGRLKWLGKQNSPFPYLAAADLLIVPSLYDSFPNVILEALHTGTPVIGSNAGGIPEMLEHKELLFEAGSSSALTQKILALAADNALYRKIQALCRHKREKYLFDWAGEFEKTMEAFNSEIEKRDGCLNR